MSGINERRACPERGDHRGGTGHAVIHHVLELRGGKRLIPECQVIDQAVKVIGTAGSTRYSYRDWVELKPAVVHSQTYTAYRGSIINEVARFVKVCRGDAEPLSTLDDAVDAQRLIEAAEVSIAEGRTVDLREGERE